MADNALQALVAEYVAARRLAVERELLDWIEAHREEEK